MPDTTNMFPTDLSQETPADSHHILADDGTAAYDLLISALAAYILGAHTETIDGAVQTVLAAIAAKYSKPGTGIPKTDLASAIQTSLGLADTALQSYTETDPTVPSWAKASTKPSYTYSEISGTPTIPSKTSDLTNDSGFLTQHQSLADYQTKSITDTGGYYTTDTVEGALQEIGAEIAGVNTLIGTGVIS